MHLIRLLWEQQRDALRKGRNHRWAPEIIAWCLSVYMRSHSTYETLRSAGFLLLPSRRTLARHASMLPLGHGITKERMEQLCNSASRMLVKQCQRCVMLVFDEMHVQVRAPAAACAHIHRTHKKIDACCCCRQADVVWDPKSNAIVGLCDGYDQILQCGVAAAAEPAPSQHVVRCSLENCSVGMHVSRKSTPY